MSATYLSKPIAQPKKRPALLDKRQRAKNTEVIDGAERAKCHKRSKGACEVKWFPVPGGRILYACTNLATENHHLLSGRGMRNRGQSILAEHRLDCCRDHHQEITGHVLQPIGPGRYDAATVAYERVK